MNFTFAEPFAPLVADAVHQTSPLVVAATLNVQFSFVVNEIDCSPVVFEKDKPLVIILASIVISDLTSSGLAGSLGLSSFSHADKHNNVTKKKKINLAVFILTIFC